MRLFRRKKQKIVEEPQTPRTSELIDSGLLSCDETITRLGHSIVYNIGAIHDSLGMYLKDKSQQAIWGTVKGYESIDNLIVYTIADQDNLIMLDFIWLNGTDGCIREHFNPHYGLHYDMHDMLQAYLKLTDSSLAEAQKAVGVQSPADEAFFEYIIEILQSCFDEFDEVFDNKLPDKKAQESREWAFLHRMVDQIYDKYDVDIWHYRNLQPSTYKH